MHFTSPETAFYEIAERAGGTWLRLITIIAVVLASAIANAMAAQAAVSRILFAMARDGKLPAILAQGASALQDPLRQHPAVAVMSLLVGLLFADRVDDLTLIVNFGALTGFVLLHLSVINHYFIRQRSGDWLQTSDVSAGRLARSSCMCCTKWIARPKSSGLPGLRSVSFTISC